jgi:hypothetical protein
MVGFSSSDYTSGAMKGFSTVAEKVYPICKMKTKKNYMQTHNWFASNSSVGERRLAETDLYLIKASDGLAGFLWSLSAL